VCLYAYICVYVCVCVGGGYVRVCMHVGSYKCVCMHVCMHVCMYVCLFVCLRTNKQLMFNLFSLVSKNVF
jgi:hypothetical protein